MGQSALYVCNKCGRHFELNTSQPDSGMVVEYIQKYCTIRHRVYTLVTKYYDFYKIPKLASDYDGSPCAKCKRCNGENLVDFISVEQDENNRITKYMCPKPKCDGVLEEQYFPCMWD